MKNKIISFLPIVENSEEFVSLLAKVNELEIYLFINERINWNGYVPENIHMFYGIPKEIPDLIIVYDNSILDTCKKLSNDFNAPILDLRNLQDYCDEVLYCPQYEIEKKPIYIGLPPPYSLYVDDFYCQYEKYLFKKDDQRAFIKTLMCESILLNEFSVDNFQYIPPKDSISEERKKEIRNIIVSKRGISAFCKRVRSLL
ncbi:MAG: hypothetical protein SNJ64_01555 [Endomicrobiia bacterium]